MEARFRERARRRQAGDSPRPGGLRSNRRLLGCGREQQRKAGMEGRGVGGGGVGGKSRGLSSGEQRQEERGMGVVGEGC